MYLFLGLTERRIEGFGSFSWQIWSENAHKERFGHFFVDFLALMPLAIDWIHAILELLTAEEPSQDDLEKIISNVSATTFANSWTYYLFNFKSAEGQECCFKGSYQVLKVKCMFQNFYHYDFSLPLVALLALPALRGAIGAWYHPTFICVVVCFAN